MRGGWLLAALLLVATRAGAQTQTCAEECAEGLVLCKDACPEIIKRKSELKGCQEACGKVRPLCERECAAERSKKKSPKRH